MRAALRIGLISDTHGLLRPEALAFLAGADHIVHGGDIGGPDILEHLARLAPLTVVRGNNDGAAWAGAIPDTARLDLGGVALYVIHDLKQLDIDPLECDFLWKQLDAAEPPARKRFCNCSQS